MNASAFRASFYSVPEGGIEDGALDLMSPRGDLCGAAIQEVVNLNGLWI